MASAAASSSLPERHRVLVLALLALIGATAFQGSRGLYEPTETRYAEVAREMIASGDYLHPTLSGNPHYTKPPLAYWSIAAGIRLLGVNAWGARFSNVLIFIITVLAVSQIGVVVWGERAGLLAGVVYATSPLAIVGAGVASTDTLLTLWVVLSMLGFVKAHESADSARRKWWIRFMWVSLGMGFMTKGPPALLPLLVIVVYRLLTRRRMGLADPLGLAAFVAAGFWWYVWIVVERPEMLGYFVGDEIVARNLTGSAHRNPQWYAPLTVFLPTLLVGALPWLVFAIRRGIVSEISDPAVTGRTPRTLSALVTLWWFAIPLVVFSLSKSRLPLYMLQVLPPMVLWIVAVILRRGTTGRTIAVTAGVTLIVLIGVKGVSGLRSDNADAGRLSSAVEDAGGAGTVVLLVDHPGEHGLEYYTNGGLTRVSVGRRADWADTTLEEVVARLQEAPDRRSSTIVVDAGHADVVIDALDQADLRYSRSRFARWELIVLRGPAVRVGRAAASRGVYMPMPDSALVSWEISATTLGCSSSNSSDSRRNVSTSSRMASGV